MFCSSSEVYGNIGQTERKITEEDWIQPANPYGASKAAIDIYMQERMTNKKIKGFITRAFSHTGPRRGKSFSISWDASELARMKRTGETALKVGNLETTRVVLDVRDCVMAYYLLMKNDRSDGQVFNVCGDTPHQMCYFTDELIRISGIKNVEKIIDPKLYRPIDIYYQHGDVIKIEKLTGWKPQIPIDQTLKDLFVYWEKKIWSLIK
jgi:GDP-4-dehydro-6-deoxy-D-mannose reductase